MLNPSLLGALSTTVHFLVCTLYEPEPLCAKEEGASFRHPDPQTKLVVY